MTMTALIHMFTIAMSSPYSADVGIHLERCVSPVIEIKPSKPIVVVSCKNQKITVDCSRDIKSVVNLLDQRGMYLAHVQCRRK